MRGDATLPLCGLFAGGSACTVSEKRQQCAGNKKTTTTATTAATAAAAAPVVAAAEAEAATKPKANYIQSYICMYVCMCVLGGALTARNELENQDTGRGSDANYGSAAEQTCSVHKSVKRPRRLTLYTQQCKCMRMCIHTHTHTHRDGTEQWGRKEGNLRAAEKQMSETAAKSSGREKHSENE